MGLNTCYEMIAVDSAATAYRNEFKKPMLEQRWFHAVCCMATDILVVSGSCTTQASSRSVEYYSISGNCWTALPSLNTGRINHSSCCYNSQKVFVFCGISLETYSPICSIEILDTNCPDETEMEW